MARRLAWVGIAVLSAYAVFIGGAWWGIYNPVLRLASVLAIAVVLAAWASRALRDPAWRPRSVLLPAIGACLASLAIASLFSRFPSISVEYLAYAVVLAALYLLLVELLRRDFYRRRFVPLAAGLFTAIVVIYVGFTISHWIVWLGIVGRLTVPPLRPEFESLTFGNPSTVLTIVAMLAVPFAASLNWSTRRGAALVAVVLGGVAIIALLSGSRAGWLALGLTAVLAAVLVVVHPGGRGRLLAVARDAVQSSAGRVALIGLVGVAAVALVVLGPAVLGRVTAGGEGNRLAFVRIALELFAESPIVGTGPGSWVIQRSALTRPTEPDEYIPHAHNVYVQTLAEQGVVGAIAGLVLAGSLLLLVVGAVRDPDTIRRRWGWATLLGLVYFAAHQLLDFYPNFPSVLLAAALPVAYLDATASVDPHRRHRWAFPERVRTRVLALGTALVTVAVVLLGVQELPALAANAAVDRANAGDWTGADGPARAAAAQDPRISSYLFTAGLTAAHAGNHDAALAYFAEVTRREDVPEAWLNLAAEQAATGASSSDVAASLTAALRLGRQRPAVAVPAGELAFRTGEQPLAIEAFTAAVLASPSLLADPWWSAEPARVELLTAVYASAMSSAQLSTGWELALMRGDADRARAVAATPGFDPSTIDFVNAWLGDEAAYGRLSERCRVDPLDVPPLLWCARIEGRRGNLDAANDYRYLANAQAGNSYRGGAELRIRLAPSVGRTLEGNPAIFWGAYTYRRFTPWDVLVPSLLHLGIA